MICPRKEVCRRVIIGLTVETCKEDASIFKLIVPVNKTVFLRAKGDAGREDRI